MKRSILCIAIVSLCAGCPDAADDCHLTLTCPLPPDTACDGECMPGPIPAWGDPFLAWIGDASQAPNECLPTSVHEPSGTWVSAPLPNACPACGCEPPSGSCATPTAVTVNAFACGGTGATIALDLPNAWDGSCVDPDPIPAGALCDGEPCVQSVTFAPTMPTGERCEAYDATTTSGPMAGATLAMACSGMTMGSCANNGDTCVPPIATTSKDAGWTYCVFLPGSDLKCPMALYPVQHVLAQSYQCTPCTCGEAEGSTCSSYVTVYTDDACYDELASDTVTEQSVPPWCLPLPAGSALGSVSATTPTYTPGKCTPSVTPARPTPIDPVTLCCLD
jgi:hypothetical protein